MFLRIYLLLIVLLFGLTLVLERCTNKTKKSEPSINDTIRVYPGDTIKYFGVDADGIVIIAPKLNPHVFLQPSLRAKKDQ